MDLTAKQYIALKNAQEALAVLCNLLGPYDQSNADNLRYEANKASNRLKGFNA